MHHSGNLQRRTPEGVTPPPWAAGSLALAARLITVQLSDPAGVRARSPTARAAVVGFMVPGHGQGAFDPGDFRSRFDNDRSVRL